MASLFSRIASRTTGSRPGTPPLPHAPIEPAPEVEPLQPEAMALARDLLHAIEQFVICTRDLDTERFLQRLRSTAAGLTAELDAPTLRLYRDWAGKALSSFAGLQRRCVTEREDEMWRLLELYGRSAAAGREGASELANQLVEAHGRIRQAASVDDLRVLRHQVEEELKVATRLVDEKARADKERVTALTRQVARLEAELASVRGQARYDVLTNIFHRGAFMHEVSERLKEGKPCTVALLDVDHFKTVNDTLGHQIGDGLLVLIADQLRRIVRSGDLASRLGGDEYAFMAAGLNPEHLAQRLAVATAKRHVRIELEQRTVSVLLSLSVGIAGSKVGDDPQSLLHRADTALLAVKRGGKGGIRIGN